MKSPLQVVQLAVFLIGSLQAIDDDYYDILSTDSPEDPNKFSDLAKRLNCSELVLRHSGAKTDEIQTNSIYSALPIELPLDYDITLKIVFEEENVTDAVVPENESTEKPIKVNDENLKQSRAKRGVVTIERLWTAENISIIDGYSKVAFYPPKAEEESSAVNENVREKRMASSENDTEECTAPFDDDGLEYNWYQIIVNNGGPPGEVKATLLNPNVTELLDPCLRPINNTSPLLEDLLYDYELIEFEKVYRHERAFVRFVGTPSEFVDIVGQLVWSPPGFAHRYYRISYRKDDTGFYVNVRRRHKCTFEENPLSVKCDRIDDYTPCDIEIDVHTKSLSVGLEAALIG